MDKKISQKQLQEARNGMAEDVGLTFEDPKLTFIEPKLTKHGDATKITQNGNGFFGTFSV